MRYQRGYLYYTGRIHAVRLDYSDAYASLLQATRKAPTGTALGFRCTVRDAGCGCGGAARGSSR